MQGILHLLYGFLEFKQILIFHYRFFKSVYWFPCLLGHGYGDGLYKVLCEAQNVD